MKLVPGVVPLSHVNDQPDPPPQPPPEGVCHVARPDASDVSTLPTHGEPPVISTCHATLRIAVVASQFVQIPIFPPLPYIQFPILS